MRWHTRPITQLVVMFAIMSLIVGVQGAASSYTSKKPQATSAVVAQEQGSGLRKVDAGCSFREGTALVTGETERNAANSLPRCPIKESNCKGEYDVLNGAYFTQVSKGALDYAPIGGESDSKVYGMLGAMFGFTPSNFSNSYDMQYKDNIGQGIRGNDTNNIKGLYPIVDIAVPADHVLLMPNTGYDIGGGEAMVTYATTTSVTLHIGRHEYFAGDATHTCNGGHCSGGYWIYLSNICVNQNIVDSYNSVKEYQNVVGPALDVNPPVKLPIVPAGYSLGKASSGAVKLALRDDGPFIAIHKINTVNDNSGQHNGKKHLWGDAPVSTITPGTPTNTPPANATASPTVPPGTTPTTTPRTTPTLPPCDMSGTSCQEGCDTGYRCSSTLCIQNGRYSSICIQNSNLTPTPTVPTTGTATPSATRTPTTAPTNVPNGGPTDTPVPPTVTPTPVATVIPGVTPNITPGATSLKISFSSSDNTLFRIIKAQADAGARSYIYYSSLNDPNTSFFQSIYSCDASSITCSYFPVPFNNITSLDRLFITFGSSDTQYHLIQPH